MEQSFDTQIFGQQVEVIHQKNNIAKPTLANNSQPLMSDTDKFNPDYQNSSQRYNRLPMKHTQTYTAATSANSSQTRSVMQNKAPKGSIGTDVEKLKSGAKCGGISLRKLNKFDSFYCNCCEQDDQINRETCTTCQGEGAVYGDSNMVRFIQYIMEFKFGLQPVYTPQDAHTCEQLDNIPSSKSIKNDSVSPSQMQSSGSQKPKKRKINLISRTLKSQNEDNRINEFCSQFIKAQPDINSTNQRCQLEKSTATNIRSPPTTPLTRNSYQCQTNQSPSPLGCPRNSSLSNNSSKDNRYSKLGLINNSSEDVTSINVGIYGMSESILDVNMTECPYVQQEDQLNIKEKIGNYGEKCGAVLQRGVRFMGLDCLDEEKSQSALNLRQTQEQLVLDQPTLISTKSMFTPTQTMSHPQTQIRQSIPCSPSYKQSCYPQRAGQRMIHKDYSCNQCNMPQIVGVRYHCSSLMCNDDYDLCEQCYQKYPHKHCMQPIFGNFERILQKIQNSSCSRTRAFINLIGAPNIRQNREKNNKLSGRVSVGASVTLEESEEANAKLIFKSSIH